MKPSFSDTNRSPIACFDSDRLRNYLAGRVDEPSSAEIESHLSECPQCEQSLAKLELDSDPLFQTLRSDGGKSSQSDSKLEQALHNAKLMNAPTQATFEQPAALHVGNELGPYQLLRPLGRGGMGMVYLARHRRLNKEVAIKLLPSAFVSKDVQARFEREIVAAGQLRHLSIVSATDAGQANGIQYLVMEFIDGLDLGQLARAVPSISIADVCEIGRQVALGLSFAHAAGMVHRDIKPSNVMLDRSGSIKLLDFGLVLLDRWDDAGSELTTIGQFLGTLDYMSPEQAERCGTVDYRADLYSLGATLFRLLCGLAPLAAAPNQSPLEKLRLLANHRPPSLKTLRADAPDELVELVDRLLSSKPEDRPPSAAHVAEHLQRLSASANLKMLLETATANFEIVDTNAIVPFRVGLRPQNQPSRSTPSNEPPRNRWHGWMAAAMLPFLFFGGYWIVLQTSQGQLVVESEVADIQLKIVRDGQSIKDLDIQTGNVSTRLAADRYEIVIQSPSDGMLVENDRFTIKNGETIIARVRRNQSNANALPLNSGTSENLPNKPYEATNRNPFLSPQEQSGEPVYEGKTFEEWFHLLKTDRSPGKAEESFAGAVALVPRERQDEMDEAIAHIFERAPNEQHLEYLIKRPKNNLVRILDAMDRNPDRPLHIIQSLFRFCIHEDSPQWDPLWNWLKIRIQSEDPATKISEIQIGEIFSTVSFPQADVFSVVDKQPLESLFVKRTPTEVPNQQRLSKRFIQFFELSRFIRDSLFSSFTLLDVSIWTEQEKSLLEKHARTILEGLDADQESLYASLCFLIGEDFSKSKLGQAEATADLNRFLIRYAQKPWFEHSPVQLRATSMQAPEIPALRIEFLARSMEGTGPGLGGMGGGGMGGGGMGGGGMGGGGMGGFPANFLVFACLDQIGRMEVSSRPIDGLKAIEDASQKLHDSFVQKLQEAATSMISKSLDKLIPKSSKLAHSWPGIYPVVSSNDPFSLPISLPIRDNLATWTYIVHRWAKYLHGTPLPDALAGPDDTGAVQPNVKRTPTTATSIKPVYQGKDFDEWLQLLKTERSLAESNAISDALNALKEPARSAELADAVMERCRTSTSAAKTYLWLLVDEPRVNLPSIFKFLDEIELDDLAFFESRLLELSIAKDSADWDLLWEWITKRMSASDSNRYLSPETLRGYVKRFGTNDSQCGSIQNIFHPRQTDPYFFAQRTNVFKRFIPLMNDHNLIRDFCFAAMAANINPASPSEFAEPLVNQAIAILKSGDTEWGKIENWENVVASLGLLRRMNRFDAIDTTLLRTRLDDGLVQLVALNSYGMIVNDYEYTVFTQEEVAIDFSCQIPVFKGVILKCPLLPLLFNHINQMEPNVRPKIGLQALANACLAGHGVCEKKILASSRFSLPKGIFLDIRGNRCGRVFTNGGVEETITGIGASSFVSFIAHRWANHLLGSPLTDPIPIISANSNSSFEGLPQDADERWVKFVESLLGKLDKNRDQFITADEWPPSEGDFTLVDKNNDGQISIAEYYDFVIKKSKK